VPVFAVVFDDDFPLKFDLADPFPKKMWVNDRYRGPHLVDCRRGATWATKVIPQEKGAPRHEIRPAFLQQWVCSILPPVFVNRHDTGRLLSEEQFNSAVRPFSDAKNTADLVKQEFVASVDSVAYEPGRSHGIITVEGRRCINTWTPTRINRTRGDATPWLRFMQHLFPIEQDRNNALRWCATLIAIPDVRMRYGLLLISTTQGVGKGTLMEKILAPLVGWHNVSVPNEKLLTDSDFNSFLVRRRLVLVHEIYAGHSKKAYDNIKSYPTDDKLTANEKNKPEYEIHNWAHFVLSSNSLLALRMVKGDRRWFVPQVAEQKQTEIYGVELNAWLVSGGLEIIHDWAHEYVAEHGAIGTGQEAPESAAKDELIRTSRSEGMQMIFNLGQMTAKSDTKVVLTDRGVRNWVAQARGLDQNDPKLESLMTVRQMLAQAGMLQVHQYASRGKDYRAYANLKAATAPNPETGSAPPCWEDLKAWKTDDSSQIDMLIEAMTAEAEAKAKAKGEEPEAEEQDSQM
jgi:hypothetical protein